MSVEETRAAAQGIRTAAVHHLRLTVSDVARARAFYTGLLGFQMLMEIGPAVLLTNGALLLGLGPPADPSQAVSGDRFDENRVGLDHLSFSVGSRAELEEAVRIFDEQGVPHAEISDSPRLGTSILVFRDPDNIQLELTAPYS